MPIGPWEKPIWVLLFKLNKVMVKARPLPNELVTPLTVTDVQVRLEMLDESASAATGRAPAANETIRQTRTTLHKIALCFIMLVL